jgi:hypothetical protein
VRVRPQPCHNCRRINPALGSLTFGIAPEAPGGLFLFRGYFFILYLGTGGLDPNAEMMLPGPLPFGAMATGGVNVRPMFHLKAMKFAVQDRSSHAIHFKW